MSAELPSRINTEHYDAVIIFNQDEDRSLAEHCKEIFNDVPLPNGYPTKVCLYNNPQFTANIIERTSELVKNCTFIFCLLTEHFPHDLVAQLSKEEVIGLTRLSRDGKKEYCVVRPLHTAPTKERRYKTPTGLTAISGIDISNIERAKEDFEELINLFIYLRIDREVQQPRRQFVLPVNDIEEDGGYNTVQNRNPIPNPDNLIQLNADHGLDNDNQGGATKKYSSYLMTTWFSINSSKMFKLSVNIVLIFLRYMITGS